MRTSNNMLKSALFALAMASAPLAAFAADSPRTSSGDALVSGQSDLSVMPRPEPPITTETTDDAHVRGDFNFDGTVNIDDLVNLLASWGNCPLAESASCESDLNGDGIVSEGDLLMLMRIMEHDQDVSHG